MSDKNENGQLAPGEKFGDYEVIKLLGQGGMGVVYLMRAQDGMQYAVKVMDVGKGDDGLESRKRFLREAAFAIKVRHPNLIPVHCVGEDRESRLCYLVMDYMPGGSLADRLSKCKRLSVEESVSIAGQVAAVLEVAHRHGVIHRDIKPENILFDLDGTPKLADMGVAKFSGGAGRTTVTTTGMIVGTPAYMAPEQMMDSHHVDARADIYSLGVVLYEMLTGSRPCAESTAVELLAKAIKGEPLPDVRTMRPEISASLAYILSLMCAPNPEERPSSSCAVIELFMKAEKGTLEVPKEMLAPVVVKRRNWRKPLIASVAAVAASVAVVAAGWLAARTIGVFAGKHEPQSVLVTNLVTQVVVVTNDATQVKTATAVDDYLGKNSRLRLQGSRSVRKGEKVGAAPENANPVSKTGEEGGESPLPSDPDAAPDGQADTKSDKTRASLSSKRRLFSDRDSSGSSTSVAPGVGGVGVAGAPVDQTTATPQKRPVFAVFVKNCTTNQVFNYLADESELRNRLADKANLAGFTIMKTHEVFDAFKRCEMTTAKERADFIDGLFARTNDVLVAQKLGVDYVLAVSIVGVTKFSFFQKGQRYVRYKPKIDMRMFGGGMVFTKSLSINSVIARQDQIEEDGIFDELIDQWVPVTIKWLRSVVGLGPDNRHRLVVMPFRSVSGSVSVFGQDVSVEAHCGEFERRLNNDLVQTRCFTMLDREFNAETRAELSRLNVENASVGDLRRIQQLLATDYMVIGTVKMHSSPAAVYNKITGKTNTSDGPFVEIRYRVIPVSTRELVYAGTVVVPYSSAGGSMVEAAISSAYIAASSKVCREIIGNIYPMRVAAKTTYELILNQGEKDVSEGDVFYVYRQSEALTDIATGETFNATEEMIASIRVTRVTPRMSYAVVVEGTPVENIEVGAVVRRSRVSTGSGSSAEAK